MAKNRWATSDRKSRLPADWDARRAKILDRDGHQCTWMAYDEFGKPHRCPEKATDVDHIQPGDDHSEHNLQSLCHRHHAIKTAKEGVAAREAKRGEIKNRLRKKPETHPAFLAMGGA